MILRLLFIALIQVFFHLREIFGTCSPAGLPPCSSTIIIPVGVNCITPGHYENCTQLTSIILSNTVLEIDDNAFKMCSGLRELKLG